MRGQIEFFPGLHPSSDTLRNSPIAAVFITNADLDHVLGLYLLRERSSLRVIAPRAVWTAVAQDLHLAETVNPFCRLDWQETSPEFQALQNENGDATGLKFRAIPLTAKAPPFAAHAMKEEGPHSVAYEFIDERTGGRLVVAPDVAEITPGLQAAMDTANAILFDGTFWSNDEFPKLTGKPRTAADMGHLTVRDGSLAALAACKAGHKVYLHINNTNPILDLVAEERAAVERAGIIVGEDGYQFDL